MFINKADNISPKAINYYHYPKEVKCEFKNGIIKRLILEKLVEDSLIFTKYYNQKSYDCIMDSVKSLFIYEKNKRDQVLTLPRKIICIFKDGTKQKLVLEKIIGDSLVFKKINTNNKNFDCNINNIEIIKVNKEGNNYIYSIGLPLLVSIYTSSFVFNAINFEPQGPGEGGFGPVIIFIVTSPFTIGSAITSIVSAINTRKNYNLRRWKIYVL